MLNTREALQERARALRQFLRNKEQRLADVKCQRKRRDAIRILKTTAFELYKYALDLESRFADDCTNYQQLLADTKADALELTLIEHLLAKPGEPKISATQILKMLSRRIAAEHMREVTDNEVSTTSE